MATFALVHGAWHGDWCWGSLPKRLAAAGHTTVASNLPCDDPAAGWVSYRDVVLRDLDAVEGNVILVGHSLGGCVVPLVASERPVSLIVLLCSFPPAPGQSLDEAVADAPDLTDPQAAIWRTSRDERDRHVWPDFETAYYAMYHDCDPAAARSTYDQLRPQAHTPFADPWPLKKWPNVPVASIVCAADRMGNPALLAKVAREAFGVEPVELPGSHSPFLSEPVALADALVNLAAPTATRGHPLSTFSDRSR
jgi:pimeloyl-ACP methyl ester carboxylesterase